MTGASSDIGLEPQVRAIFHDSAAMFRSHFRVVVGTAAVVLVPFAILDGLGLLRLDTASHEPLVAVGTVLLATATAGLSGLASIFYAGLLDHTAAAWHEDRASPRRRSVARELPWLALVLASVIGFFIETVGLLLLVIPGLVAATLLTLTGPVLVSEQLSAGAALRRSAYLVSRAPLLVLVAVVIPATIENAIADFAGIILGHHIALEIGAEIVVTLFGAAFVGILEVATAHHLQQRHPPARRVEPRRRGRGSPHADPIL